MGGTAGAGRGALLAPWATERLRLGRKGGDSGRARKGGNVTFCRPGAGREAGVCRGWRETARWWLELERLHHAGHPKRAASAAPATATVRAGISLCWPLRRIRRADAPQDRQATRDRVTPSDSGCNPSRLRASVSMSRASPKGLTHKSVPADPCPQHFPFQAVPCTNPSPRRIYA